MLLQASYAVYVLPLWHGRGSCTVEADEGDDYLRDFRSS